MTFVNIDAPGHRRDRAAVSQIQKRHGKEERLAAAQARRDGRRAKRASGPNVIVLSKMPQPITDAIVNTRPPRKPAEGIYGVAINERDGAYVWGGNPEVKGCYQIVVVGGIKGTDDDYCKALVAWLGKPFRLQSSVALTGTTAEVAAEMERRGFLSLIFEPVA